MFAKATSTYLSRQVCQGQWHLVDAKVTAIANFLWGFRHNFASIVRPLIGLFSPNYSFVWDGKCDQALQMCSNIQVCNGGARWGAK